GWAGPALAPYPAYALPHERRCRLQDTRPCVLTPDPVSLSRPLPERLAESSHAPLPVLFANPARDAQGSADRFPPLDAEGRHDPTREQWDLRLSTTCPACLAQDLRNRARGAGPSRRDRTPDADHPVGRSLARKRALRGLRQGNAPHQGST